MQRHTKERRERHRLWDRRTNQTNAERELGRNLECMRWKISSSVENVFGVKLEKLVLHCYIDADVATRVKISGGGRVNAENISLCRNL